MKHGLPAVGALVQHQPVAVVVDALFFGFSPDLVVGIWTGFDTPKTLGEGEGGGDVTLLLAPLIFPY